MATVVTGLDLFDVKLDAAAKIFKKKFACGSSAVKGLPGQSDHVEVQVRLACVCVLCHSVDALPLISLQGDFEGDLDEIILQNYPQVVKQFLLIDCHMVVR